MSKLGHEAPHNDNSSTADMTSHAEDAQLRLGDPSQEPVIKAPEVPPGLKLTEREEARIDELKGVMGLDQGTAVQQTVSRTKANRIIGHHHSSNMTARIIEREKEREAEAQAASASKTDEVAQILRETNPDK